MRFQKGMKVRFDKAAAHQVRFGDADHPLKAGLVENEIYTIEDVEEHNCHTKITLKEVGSSLKFNSECFEPQELLLG